MFCSNNENYILANQELDTLQELILQECHGHGFFCVDIKKGLEGFRLAYHILFILIYLFVPMPFAIKPSIILSIDCLGTLQTKPHSVISAEVVLLCQNIIFWDQIHFDRLLSFSILNIFRIQSSA